MFSKNQIALPLKSLLSPLSGDSFLSSMRIFFFIPYFIFSFIFFVPFFFFPTHLHPEFLAQFAGSSKIQTTNQMIEEFVYRL